MPRSILRRLPAVFLFFVLLLVATAVSADIIDTRIALVVGNANYEHFGVLKNPTNDATDIAETLSAMGFEVTLLVDAGHRQLVEAVRDFGNSLAADGGLGLFYYAGHGIEVGGTNYLIPVDADIAAEDEVEFSSVALDFVVGKMASARNANNILILDACRDNPLPASRRSAASSRGLSVVQAPTGTLIVYATEPGRAALDGEGRNSPFTTAFLEHAPTPNLDVELMLREVRSDVIRTTGGEQTPWTNSSLTQSIVFRPVAEDQEEAPPARIIDPPTATPVRVAPRPLGLLELALPSSGEVATELVPSDVDSSPLGLGVSNEVPVGTYVLRARFAEDSSWALEREVEITEARPVRVDLRELGYSRTHQLQELYGVRADLEVAMLPQISSFDALTTAGWITLGTGVAGAGASLVLYLLGSDLYSRYQSANSSAEAASLSTQYKSFGSAFAVTAGIAGTLLATTPILWLARPDVSGHREEAESVDARIRELEAQR